MSETDVGRSRQRSLFHHGTAAKESPAHSTNLTTSTMFLSSRIRAILPTLALMVSPSASMMVLPTSMQVTEPLQSNLPTVYDAPFIPLTFGPLGVTEGTAQTWRDLAQSTKAGSIAYIVRRPG